MLFSSADNLENQSGNDNSGENEGSSNVSIENFDRSDHLQ